MAAAGFFDIHILSQTGLACHSRAPLSPSPQSLHPSPSSAPPPSAYPSTSMWGWLGFETWAIAMNHMIVSSLIVNVSIGIVF